MKSGHSFGRAMASDTYQKEKEGSDMHLTHVDHDSTTSSNVFGFGHLSVSVGHSWTWFGHGLDMAWTRLENH